MSMASFIVRGVLIAAALWQGPVMAAEPGSANAPLKVLVIRGLWHEQVRLDEGLALAGAGLVEDAWVWDGAGSGWPGPGDQGAGGLMDFPDAAGLAGYDVVVAANVNAKSFGKSADDLAAYVRNGGALFLLGGRFAFGKEYQASPLAGIAPVDFPGLKKWGSDLSESTDGFELKPGPDTLGAGFGALAWARKPLLFWVHDVVPKNGTKVLVTAGGKPVLAVGESGKGRVAVFAGTVMGDPAEGQAAFWAWDGWPVIESAVLQWLGGGRPGAGAAAVSESTLKTVEAALGKMDADKLMEAASLGEEETKLDPALEKALADEARRCRSYVQAAFLVKSVNRIPADMSPSLAEILQAAVLPYAGAAEEKAARDLIKSGQPFKTALGLALLGGSKAPDTAGLLERFYQTGKPQEAAARPDAAGDGLMEIGGAANKPVLPEDAKDMAAAIRLGALAGLGHAGDAAALAILRKAMGELRGAGGPKPKEYADVLTRDNRLYQQAVMSALRCGDETAARPMVEALMENIYIVARARNESNKSKDILARVQSQVGSALVWQREMYRQLALVPDTVRPALAACMAAEKDRRVIYPAFAVFGGRPALPEASGLLKKSPVPAVAALGCRPSR